MASGRLLRRPAGERRARFTPFQFFGEVVGELKRVTWPSRPETTRLTILVIMVSIVIGIFLFAFDQVFNILLDLLLQAGR